MHGHAAGSGQGMQVNDNRPPEPRANWPKYACFNYPECGNAWPERDEDGGRLGYPSGAPMFCNPCYLEVASVPALLAEDLADSVVG